MALNTAGDETPDVNLQIQVRAVAGEVSGIRHAVLAAARASGRTAAELTDIGLATTEACANVVAHAYADSAPGLMFVETSLIDGEFVVVVCDEGGGIAPRADSPGLGFGLALIARLTHRMEIGSNGRGGAKVTMAFGLAG